jgi:hypothetical protein
MPYFWLEPYGPGQKQCTRQRVPLVTQPESAVGECESFPRCLPYIHYHCLCICMTRESLIFCLFFLLKLVWSVGCVYLFVCLLVCVGVWVCASLRAPAYYLCFIWLWCHPDVVCLFVLPSAGPSWDEGWGPSVWLGAGTWYILGFLAKPGQSWLRIYGERGMPGGTDRLETAWPGQHQTIWRTQVVPIKCVYQMAPYSHVVHNFWPGPIGYRVPFGTKLYCFWPSLHQAFLYGSAIWLGSQYDTNNCGLETLRLPGHPNSLSLFHFISFQCLFYFCVYQVTSHPKFCLVDVEFWNNYFGEEPSPLGAKWPPESELLNKKNKLILSVAKQHPSQSSFISPELTTSGFFQFRISACSYLRCFLRTLRMHPKWHPRALVKCSTL